MFTSRKKNNKITKTQRERLLSWIFSCNNEIWLKLKCIMMSSLKRKLREKRKWWSSLNGITFTCQSIPLSSLYAFLSIFVRKLQYLWRIHIIWHVFKNIYKIGWWLSMSFGVFVVSRDESAKNEIFSHHQTLSTHFLRCILWAVLFFNLQLTENSLHVAKYIW